MSRLDYAGTGFAKLAHLLLTQPFSTFLLSHRIVVYMFLSECKDSIFFLRIIRIILIF